MENSMKKIFEEVNGKKPNLTSQFKERAKHANFVMKHAINIPEPYMGVSGSLQEALKTLFSKTPTKNVNEIVEDMQNYKAKVENPTFMSIVDKLSSLKPDEIIFLKYSIDDIDYKEEIVKDEQGNIQQKYVGFDTKLNKNISPTLVKYSSVTNFFKNPHGIYKFSDGLKDPDSINLHCSTGPLPQ
jgi:hypothetical protein